jgi:uracil-DNA glycosylase
MLTIENLINQVQKEAKREDFPIDFPVYESAKKDPTHPVLYGGNLKSPLCFFGRDLGKDEVFAQQPLIGSAGRLVRKGFYEAVYGKKTDSKEELNRVCDRILLSNTVPYKPPGNKAYAVAVKERFRPFVASLLVFHWSGKQIITLGTEAFKWFSPYSKKGELDSFFKGGDRFSTSLEVILSAQDDQGMTHQKSVTLLPLPHPSPLNQTYYAKFPQMLQDRLKNINF